jgi:hypothetical protein
MPQSSAAWEDTAPMPKLEPALPWPSSTASSADAGAARRTAESPPKPGIQGLEVKELDSQTVFDQLFGANPDAKPPGRTQR